MWLWLVSYALFSLQSTWKSRRTVATAPAASGDIEATAADADAADVTHLIILPNYKEDASILSSTLTALAQAHGSGAFRIMLAMEAREGPKAIERAEYLKEQFGHKFARLSAAVHPLGLVQEHLTGASVPEVPGKSSNLKWAVRQAFEDCVNDGI